MPDINLLNDFIYNHQEITLGTVLKLLPAISRRTAQRLLSKLVSEGKLVAIGKGRARRYKAAVPKTIISRSSKDTFSDDIPISEDSRDILIYVDKPIVERKPIGYQIDFLESYLPNKTFYLSLPLRTQLRKMGTLEKKIQESATYERAILGRLLIDLSWASSQLEGNTYSLLDTKRLIEQGKSAAGKAAIETQMILNHKSAIELFVNNIDSIGFNRYTILNLHSTLSENLLANPADEGRLRQHIVEISKSVFYPLAIPQKIEEIFDTVLKKASQIQDPFEQAFFIMVHIPYLQPFIDINKRTSRLAANIPLIRHQLCPLTFLGVTERAYTRAILGVYELTRVELLRDLFVWAYERSTQEYNAIKQELAEPDPLRLRYREFIKQIVHDIVTKHQKNSVALVQEIIKKNIPVHDQINMQALVIEELRRLHEGMLARYHLRISEFQLWKKRNHRL